eukprot:3267437-Pleurochrysis_carterae.AAC.1
MREALACVTHGSRVAGAVRRSLCLDVHALQRPCMAARAHVALGLAALAQGHTRAAAAGTAG